MSESETILEADGLRVVFFRRGDRYAQRVESFDDATQQWQPALESLEGEPGDEWPPSPPFQQLHVERRTSGPVVLLIGMAGKTHWSAAVEVAADRKSIIFDVAARHQSWPEYLGSNYSYVESAAAGRLAWSSDPTTSINLDDRFSDGWSIRPYGEIASPPSTVAWRYAIAVKAVA